MNDGSKRISSQQERVDASGQRLRDDDIVPEIIAGAKAVWKFLKTVVEKTKNNGDDFIDMIRNAETADEAAAKARKLFDDPISPREGQMSDGRRALTYDDPEGPPSSPGGMRPATYGEEEKEAAPMAGSFLDNPENLEVAEKEKLNVDLHYAEGQPNMGGNPEDGGDVKLGKQIMTLQNALLAKGYELPKYGVDGWYGKETAAAVKKFQEENGMDPTGNVDGSTMEKLLNE